MEKIFISANKLLADSFALAAKVLESGYEPTFIIGVWRGGAPVAIAVHEFLEASGLQCDHIAVRTKSYSGIDNRDKTVQVDGLEYLANNINADDCVLIVDDVHDSGFSMAALLKEISKCTRPKEIKIATNYFKPKRNQVDFKPDFYIEESEQWLVFPHELVGLTKHEILKNKPEVEKQSNFLCNI